MPRGIVLVNSNNDAIAAGVKLYLSRKWKGYQFLVQTSFTELRHVVVFGDVDIATQSEMRSYGEGVKDILEKILH